MIKLIGALALVLSALALPAEAARHSDIHQYAKGGHYQGGHGGSHKGGHYKNPRTGDHYTHHKH